MNLFNMRHIIILYLCQDFDNDGVIKPGDIQELVDRITGVTGKNKLGDNDAERNRLSYGEGGEMEKVIKHVR